MTTEIVEQQSTAITVPDLSRAKEALSGMSADDIQIPTVKWPSGGATAFQVPDATGNLHSQENIVGVVVDDYSFDALYLETYDDNPDARAEAIWVRGELMFATQTAVDAGIDLSLPLADQPLNEFGTAELIGFKGGGKAIQNRWSVYVVQNDDVLPVRISIPSMSRKTWSNYRFKRSMRAPLTSFVVTLGLASEKNKAGQPFSELRIVGDELLPPDAAEKMAELAEALKPLTTFTGGGEGNLVGASSGTPTVVSGAQTTEPVVEESGDVSF